MRYITLAALLVLSACTTAQTTKVTSAVSVDLATAQADLNTAIKDYQVGLGLAQVAEVAYPTITPTVTKITAVVAPLMSAAQIALDSATADAPTIEGLAQQITKQAASLTVAAAPSIKAVAN